jgi:hypothetical protein
MAPFCAPLLLDVEIAGVAATWGVAGQHPGPPPLIPPLPHPHNKLTDKKIAASIPSPARIFLVSRSRRFNRNHTAATMKPLPHRYVNCEFA